MQATNNSFSAMCNHCNATRTFTMSPLEPQTSSMIPAGSASASALVTPTKTKWQRYDLNCSKAQRQSVKDLGANWDSSKVHFTPLRQLHDNFPPSILTFLTYYQKISSIISLDKVVRQVKCSYRDDRWRGAFR